MIDGRRRRRPEREVEPVASPRATARLALGARLVRHGVSANAVTVAGVVLAGGTAVLVGLGHLWIGVGLIIVGGLMDALDGAVAKAAGSSSRRGAFIDSVADRVCDALIFGGVTWYLLAGRDPRAAIVPVAIMAVASVVSYERAKAESLGLSARGGLMERAERLILLGVALFFNVVLVPILIALLVLTTVTAVGRFVRIWRQAGGSEARRPRREFVAVGVESRLRAWRETGRVTKPRRPRRERQALAMRLRTVLGVEQTHRLGSAAGRGRSIRAAQRRFERGR